MCTGIRRSCSWCGSCSSPGLVELSVPLYQQMPVRRGALSRSYRELRTSEGHRRTTIARRWTVAVAGGLVLAVPLAAFAVVAEPSKAVNGGQTASRWWRQDPEDRGHAAAGAEHDAAIGGDHTQHDAEARLTTRAVRALRRLPAGVVEAATSSRPAIRRLGDARCQPCSAEQARSAPAFGLGHIVGPGVWVNRGGGSPGRQVRRLLAAAREGPSARSGRDRALREQRHDQQSLRERRDAHRRRPKRHVMFMTDKVERGWEIPNNQLIESADEAVQERQGARLVLLSARGTRTRAAIFDSEDNGGLKLHLTQPYGADVLYRPRDQHAAQVGLAAVHRGVLTAGVALPWPRHSISRRTAPACFVAGGISMYGGAAIAYNLFDDGAPADGRVAALLRRRARARGRRPSVAPPGDVDAGDAAGARPRLASPPPLDEHELLPSQSTASPLGTAVAPIEFAGPVADRCADDAVAPLTRGARRGDDPAYWCSRVCRPVRRRARRAVRRSARPRSGPPTSCSARACRGSATASGVDRPHDRTRRGLARARASGCMGKRAGIHVGPRPAAVRCGRRAVDRGALRARSARAAPSSTYEHVFALHCSRCCR